MSEVANVAWKKVVTGRLSAADAQLMRDDAVSTAVTLLPSRRLGPTALQIALALRHPVYDCVYLACAADRASPLMTADRRLLRAVAGGSLGVEVRDLAEM